MAFDQKGLNDYIDVAQRIADFRELYPSGSLQPLDPANPFEIRQVEGQQKDGKMFTATFVIYTAACYRSPEDTRPGIGTAWEVYPGRTPYTLGSELMNAETSAWGRAIIAALASDSKRGVASREEVRNRAAEQEAQEKPARRPRQPSAPAREPLGPPPGPRPLAELPRNADRSIKVSECTEEELAANGFLTGEKRAEHDALRKGANGRLAPEDKGRFTPCSPGNPCAEADCPNCTPDADLWTDAPPPVPLRTPQPAMDPAVAIVTHFKRLGYTDRDVRLGMTATLARTGRLRTTNDLNAEQGRRVLEILSSCKDADALDRKLKAAGAVLAGA